MPLTSDQIREAQEQILREWRPKPLDEIVDHRQRVRTRIDQLGGYSNRSQPQEVELEDLTLELTTLDDLIPEVQTQVRAEQRERVRAAALDSANREAGAPGQLGRVEATERTARAAGYSRFAFRTAAPWDGLTTAAWSSESMRTRAHSALEAIDGMDHDAREALAAQFDDPDGDPAAARMAVALSDPHYLRAYSHVLRDPIAGAASWTEPQRMAMERVRTSVRSAMTVATGSLGWAIPLVLDPTVVLTNAGSKNPWRQLASNKRTTAVTWNGVTSTGSSAGWVAEGVAIGDTSPSLVQLQVTPQKAATFIFGSWEAIGVLGQGASETGDVESWAQQLPTFFADAKDALEVGTFATGAGTGAIPQGFLTFQGTATDSTVVATAARLASDITGLMEGVSPRFRGGTARNAFLASLTWIDKYRLTGMFGTGSLVPVVSDDSGAPRSFSTPWFECSALTTGTAAAQRAVLYGDWSQMYIVDRWPGFTLYDPWITGTGAAANQPTGQAGWLYAWRTGVTYTTTGAFKVLRFT
jgi:HK97 family phage major capsid protein